LNAAGRRLDDVAEEEVAIVAASEDASLRVALDFVKPDRTTKDLVNGEWQVTWHAVALRFGLFVGPAQTATLSWFYAY
jgi:hypothetical protein